MEQSASFSLEHCIQVCEHSNIKITLIYSGKGYTLWAFEIPPDKRYRILSRCFDCVPCKKEQHLVYPHRPTHHINQRIDISQQELTFLHHRTSRGYKRDR